jgi:hypothetical protein
MKKNCRGKCGRHPCLNTACAAFCPGPFGLWDFGNLADILLLVCFHLFHSILAARRLALGGALLQCTSDFLTCVEKSSRMRVERFEVLLVCIRFGRILTSFPRELRDLGTKQSTAGGFCHSVDRVLGMMPRRSKGTALWLRLRVKCAVACNEVTEGTSVG